MNLNSFLRINISKLRFYPMKAAFLIVPIGVLVTVAILVSGQVKNVSSAIRVSIFDALKDQYTLLTVSDQQQDSSGGSTRQGPPAGGRGFFSQTTYNETDAARIKALANVVDAQVQYSVPLTNATVQDVVSDKDISLSQIQTLSSDLASVYTDKNFSYTEGQPIPIILNASALIETYEEWNGQTSVTVDLRSVRPTGNTPPDPSQLENLLPVRQRAISYDKDSLIGKTFTLTVGGLPAAPTYAVTRDEGVMTYTQLTDEQKQTYLDTRNSALSPYWNVDTLSQPITYQVVVVGVIDDANARASYIPTDFAQKAFTDMMQHQLDARTTTAIPTTALDNTAIKGLTYDGSELSSGQNGGFFTAFNRGGGNRPGATTSIAIGGPDDTSSDTYTVPGLVIQTNNSGTVQGAYTDTNVFADSVKTGSTINVRINDAANRDSIVAAINAAGYAMQDANNLKVVAQLQNTLNTLSTATTSGFVVLTAIVVFFSMTKYITESKKEIGIFRAFGYTKRQIVIQYLSQGLLYTLIGSVAGALLGVIAVYATAHVIHARFADFVHKTVAQTTNVVPTVALATFQQLNFVAMATVLGLLLLVTILAALIPSLRASRMNPVEAIKAE